MNGQYLSNSNWSLLLRHRTIKVSRKCCENGGLFGGGRHWRILWIGSWWDEEPTPSLLANSVEYSSNGSTSVKYIPGDIATTCWNSLQVVSFLRIRLESEGEAGLRFENLKSESTLKFQDYENPVSGSKWESPSRFYLDAAYLLFGSIFLDVAKWTAMPPPYECPYNVTWDLFPPKNRISECINSSPASRSE